MILGAWMEVLAWWSHCLPSHTLTHINAHIYTHARTTHMHMHTLKYTLKYTHTYTLMYTHTYTYTYTHTYTYTYTHAQIHTHIHTLKFTHVHTHVHIYTCTHTHTHSHTHSQSLGTLSYIERILAGRYLPLPRSFNKDNSAVPYSNEKWVRNLHYYRMLLQREGSHDLPADCWGCASFRDRREHT